MEETGRYTFNSTDLLYKIYVYRKTLIILTVAAFIISAIISLFIQEKFKATVVLFPAPATSFSQTYISSISQKTNSVFGEEEEVEQLLQTLNSEQIKQRIITKYNLQNHYEIEPDEKYIHTKLSTAYKSNITFKRTEYMAVEISVLDKSPDTAALIANDIASLLDSTMNRMQRERATQAFKIVEYEYFEKLKQIKKLEDSLAFLMSKGVFDFESQAEVFNSAYASAIASGNASGAQKLKKQLDTLARYGSAYVAVRDLLMNETLQLSLLIQRYKEARVDSESELTHLYIIDRAFTPDKKTYPKRSIIVLVSTVSAFVIGFVMLILLELYREFKKKTLNTSK